MSTKLICEHCNNVFVVDRTKETVLSNKTDKTSPHTWQYCSWKCYQEVKTKNNKEYECSNCGKVIIKTMTEIKRSKTGNTFCSQSCSAIYSNSHRTYGTRRSKLEIWLETKLTKIYPDLKFNFNKNDTIKSELDIYIPSLKLAFELNGIYHYEPIHGQDKLTQIQNNDINKFQKCQELGISLCIIDVSSMKHFKEVKAMKYLEIISNIIRRKLGDSHPYTPCNVDVPF